MSTEVDTDRTKVGERDVRADQDPTMVEIELDGRKILVKKQTFPTSPRFPRKMLAGVFERVSRFGRVRP